MPFQFASRAIQIAPAIFLLTFTVCHLVLVYAEHLKKSVTIVVMQIVKGNVKNRILEVMHQELMNLKKKHLKQNPFFGIPI